MTDPSTDDLHSGLLAQIQELMAIRDQQNLRMRHMVADQARQLDLIDQQSALLLELHDVYQQRLNEAAIFSFSLDHENIELRRTVRELEGRLAGTFRDASCPVPEV